VRTGSEDDEAAVAEAEAAGRFGAAGDAAFRDDFEGISIPAAFDPGGMLVMTSGRDPLGCTTRGSAGPDGGEVLALFDAERVGAFVDVEWGEGVADATAGGFGAVPDAAAAPLGAEGCVRPLLIVELVLEGAVEGNDGDDVGEGEDVAIAGFAAGDFEGAMGRGRGREATIGAAGAGVSRCSHHHAA